MNKIKTSAFAVLALLCAYAAPSVATPIYGDTTNGLGGESFGEGEWVEFYIPLDGVSEYAPGTGYDRCSTYSSNPNNQCNGGTLHMFMNFAIDWSGDTTLTIDFVDFDSGEYGDNSWFAELLALVIYDEDGTELYSFSEADLASLVTGDRDSQQIVLTGLDVDGPFNVEFIFSSQFADHVRGRYRNTPEDMRAHASHSVPEPGTLALLGAGLLLLGFSRRRRRVLDH